MQYEISREVEKVATRVIKEHLSDLGPKKIVYVTQEKKDDKTGVAVAQMRKGKPIIGDIKIIGGLNAFLATGEARTDHDGPAPFPCLVVSKHAWNLLKPEQRKAWVHQQLNRLIYDNESGKPSLIDYDVKEFSIIAKLYGAWNDDLNLFLKTAKQHPLFEDLDSTPDPEPPAQAASAEAKQQITILKGNGKAKDNGADKSEEPKANGIADLKQEVARRRSGARSTA